MRFFEKIFLGALALAAGVSAQERFEPLDFNVTEALIDNGINISAIPELGGLVVRSSTKGCSIAVDIYWTLFDRPELILYIVQFAQAHLRRFQSQHYSASNLLVSSTEPSRAVLHIYSYRGSRSFDFGVTCATFSVPFCGQERRTRCLSRRLEY